MKMRGKNDLEAWERAYADDRSWESLQEDDSGFLLHIDTNILHHDQYRRHLRSVSATPRIQKGLIRYLYLVIDLSKAAGEMDFKPSRMAVVAKYAEAFIREFFDQIGKFISVNISARRLEELIVALDEFHFKDFLLEHAPPPLAIAEFAVSNLIKMGFPQRGAEGVISICSCHKEVKVGGGYTCPRCKAHVCELPTECQICGLTLVSSPHLAKSYHHLFPITPFNEVLSALLSNPRHTLPRVCFGYQQTLRASTTVGG
ncbi:hypothetical protein GIB67_030211 [Kingdonia uniflora]|uniref:Ssl1-like domain-containing protein n=1 Tax=Kingdonia uniflora TaxID=39325 RepID=A0A7J7MNB5_9MAGN|nr:hypothetical protein GIB67_030211 [Kingdonia uniflora]